MTVATFSSFRERHSRSKVTVGAFLSFRRTSIVGQEWPKVHFYFSGERL